MNTVEARFGLSTRVDLRMVALVLTNSSRA